MINYPPDKECSDPHAGQLPLNLVTVNVIA